MRRHHLKIRKRSALARHAFAAACVGGGAIACAVTASAQPLDTNPPLPDVLLLTDTSGSMELMMDGCNTDTGLYANGSGGGNCNGTIPNTSTTPYCDGVTARTANRWGTEVAALTGDFINPSLGGPGYSCLSMPRASGTAFANEFSLQYASGATVPPYDLNYYLNFHRPAENLSSTTACVYGFIQGPPNGSGIGWYADHSASHQENPSSSPPIPDFQAAAIQGYIYNIATMTPTTSPPTPCSGGFTQSSDGLIEYGLNSIRFGLMTIDSDTLPNTGVTATDGVNLTFTDVANGGALTNVTTGMWSYYNGWSSGIAPTWTGASVGRPAGCNETGISEIPFEVGGRNPAAPPWEGRMIRFPSGATTSPASNNQNIMQAIRVMRPYGANPIAGMMDDAKFYFWMDAQGPSAVDPLVSCRTQYIILLSHAAPNEDLEPYCQGSANGFPGICPYDYPEYIAAGLNAGTYSPTLGVKGNQSAAASGAIVKTFVVGFSLSSSLGDAGTASCNDILQGVAPNQTINTSTAFCGVPSTNGADSGTTGNPLYASCCALARIAVNGGTGVPYFADNQTDLQKAFQAILAIIVANATTRAPPVLLPQSSSSTTGGGAGAALFLSSFIPSPTVTWSGDVQRERYQCATSSSCTVSPCSLAQPITPSNGDDFASNLQQSQSTSRNVIMVEPYPPTGTGTPARNPSTTIRPWVNGSTGTTATSTAFDGYTMYDGVESGFSYKTTGSYQISASFNTQITPDVFFPSGCSYKQPGGAVFSTADCESIALGFALGMQNAPPSWNAALSAFPTRYFTAGAIPQSPGPFGGVYHSTPALEVPPSALLRDDSYQTFTESYTSGYTTSPVGKEPRHTVLYVATIDGLLHAFGVDYNASDPYTFIGSSHTTEGGTAGLMNEMWTFVPPAVMPNLMSAVGGGETNLLDGAPVVKDTIYQRTTVGPGTDWHTALVAGFGAAGPGYYALDVTDPDFNNRGATPSSFGPAHNTTNSNTPPAAPSGYVSTSALPMGPHFLWQFTDSNLFAQTGGTPAIATVAVNDPDNNGKLTDIGVAILPGGAGVPGSTTLGCPRVSYNPKITDASPEAPSALYPLAAKVRQWTSSGCPSATNPARGRSLTIVRLDTGEVLRTFTVMSDLPTPTTAFPLYNVNSSGAVQKNNAGYNYLGRVTQAEFDSPVSGTPVPYPSDVGAITQRVFVGDQDGTIWRLDVSNPDPNQWFVEPFFDAYNTAVQAVAGISNNDSWAVQRAPIVLAPSVSIGRDGNVVLNFGTGDNNAIGTASNQNYVYSVTELPNTTAKRLLANVNWYLPLALVGTSPNQVGEMMVGPTAVFDGGYYFATYTPAAGGSTGCTSGESYIWGMDYTTAAGSNGLQPTTAPSPPDFGGVAKLLNSTSSLVQKLPQTTSIIPGVTITATSACSTTTAGTDPVTGGPMLSASNVSPASYQISALEGKPGTSQGNNTSVAQVNVATSVHASTLVDSWASIVE